MTEGLTVPATIEEIIKLFDASTESVEEMALSEKINQARNALIEPSSAEGLGAWAEALAFALTDGGECSPWSSHFCPMGSSIDKDGNKFYFPDIAGTPSVVVDHWIERAKSMHHPVMVARYADLAWDFARPIGQRKRDPEMARIAIDAYTVSASGNWRSENYYRYPSLARALELAVLINDQHRIDKVRAEFLRLHREIMKEDQNDWWRAFDALVGNKNARLADEERSELIADAEKVVTLRSDASSPRFDPHATEHTANRLIKLYAKEHRGEDIARLHLVIAKTFEHFAGMGDAMLASSLLQTSLNNYSKAGQSEEAKRIRIAMQEKIGESRNEMKSIGTEITIKKDDVEAFLNGVILPDLGQTFVRLAIEFLPKRTTLEETVKKSAEIAPLMAHISQHIMSDNRVVAIIGSVEDDLFGRCFHRSNLRSAFRTCGCVKHLSVWLRCMRSCPSISPVGRTGIAY